LDDNPLKIAMLSIHSSPTGQLGTRDTGGMSVYIRELAKALGECGHMIDIFTRLNNHNHKTIETLHPNVRLIHLDAVDDEKITKSMLFPYLKDFFRVLEAFRKEAGIAYDLIHSHYWLSGQLGQFAQHRWHIPHVLMFHTLGSVKNQTEVGKAETEFRISAEKRLAKACHRILAPTHREKERLIQYYDVAADRIGVVPCGVNLDLFQPMDKEDARRQLGLTPEVPVLLFVGRFDPLKGIDRLLSTMTHLKHRGNLRLVIIGGDGDQSPEFKRLQRVSSKLGIQEAVSFVGRVDQKNLPPYYSAADILVIPSYYESFGLVGLESLACGTPVVSTKVGVLEDILKQNDIGRLVENATPRSLADGIEKILSVSSDSRLRDERIRSAVIRFQWPAVASAITAEYHRMIGRHPQRPRR
jgi:D-inositol-3-phosphate glycosyltransferase